MADTVQHKKSYKKFFQRKALLDIMRLQLDVSEEFLVKMKLSRLLTPEEYSKVKSLEWPHNRNTFLQILIRKHWNKAMFDEFMHVLQETQEKQFADAFPGWLEMYFKADRSDSRHADDTTPARRTKPVPKDALDVELGGSTSDHVKNVIRSKIMHKDQQIKQLHTENVTMHDVIQRVTADNEILRHDMQRVEGALADILAATDMEMQSETVDENISDLRHLLTKQRKSIEDLKDENRKLAATNDDLRGKMTILTDKLITLKSTATSLEHILEQEKQSSKAKLEKLTTKLADAKTKLSEAAAKEGDYLRIIQDLEERVESQGERMRHAVREADQAVREREAAEQELHRVNDRTRKLLRKMNLTSSIDNMAFAADYARDIAYALKRRRNTQPPNSNATPRESVFPIGEYSDDSPAPGDSGDHLNTATEIGRRSTLNGDLTQPQSTTQRNTKALWRGKCSVCGRMFAEASNFDGACVFHKPGAERLNDGTGVAVWSCCKSVDTAKGCQKARHVIAA
ncbi:hypothetical protein LSAT2_014691 [Lamellibrachia satsuma]|nr:hypothetical protein LSAT2_014691 [Lamellibrachia satsuma]